MPLVVVNEGELSLLAWMLKLEEFESGMQQLSLYQNDVTPDKNTVLTDLVEADFDGYAPIDLARGTWTSPVTVGGKAKTFYGASAQQWEVTGPTGNTIYGYYVHDVPNGVLLWAQRFASPKPLQEFDTLDVYPEFTLNSEYDP